MTTTTIRLQESDEGYFEAQIEDDEVRLVSHVILNHDDKPLRLEPLYPRFQETYVAYITTEQWLQIAKAIEEQA